MVAIQCARCGTITDEGTLFCPSRQAPVSLSSSISDVTDAPHLGEVEDDSRIQDERAGDATLSSPREAGPSIPAWPVWLQFACVVSYLGEESCALEWG